MQLIIAEKPDQGAKLAAPFNPQKKKDFITIPACPHFPEGAVVTWAVGHLCELVPPENYRSEWKTWSMDTLPILPQEFRFQVIKGKGKAFQTIKSFIHDKNVTGIIHAGDAEREGEAIIRMILHQARNYKPVKRLWISSLTPDAVKDGFSTLLDSIDTDHLYDEALSRSFADWLVGINASRAYTLQFKKHGINDVYSTGRVQTPTLALIVKREKEIDEFVSKPFWEVHATFSHPEGSYQAVWHKDGDSRLLNSVMAERIQTFCTNRPARILDQRVKQKAIPAPAFFNLSSLQAAMNKRYTFSPKYTLEIAQKLYVKGYISYPRTDSTFITTQEERQFPGILKKLEKKEPFSAHFPLPFASLQNRNRYVNEKKVRDHYAIIPTEQVPSLSKLSADEQKIYEVIVNSLIAAHYPPLMMSYTEIDTIVDERAEFKSKGKSVIAPGWRDVIPFPKAKSQEQWLPTVNKGDAVTGDSFEIKESETKPPKRYTEGELITLMKTAGKHVDDRELTGILHETEGLGTEATRANIIAVLQQRNYITITKNTVFPTHKGKLLITALGSSPLASPAITARWEQALSSIGNGKTSKDEFMASIHTFIQNLIDESLHLSNEWAFTPEDIEKLPKRKSKWDAYKKRSKEPLGPCPICGAQVMDKGKFYGCEAYRSNKCSFTLSKRIMKKTLPKTAVKNMLKSKESPVMSGFQSKGKSFAASMIWSESEKRFIFDFKEPRKTKPE